jgi:hypothetical protein
MMGDAGDCFESIQHGAKSRELQNHKRAKRNDFNSIMFNSSRVVHTLGRRALATTFRSKVVSQQLGAIRLSSYFTPGKQ